MSSSSSVCDQPLFYAEFMYNMQWILFQDHKDEYFTSYDKEQWIQLLPQVWLGVSDQLSMTYEDVLSRIGQLFGREQLRKLMDLIARNENAELY